jgi:hypothetical protein
MSALVMCCLGMMANQQSQVRLTERSTEIDRIARVTMPFEQIDNA